jgi:hypothetical protein
MSKIGLLLITNYYCMTDFFSLQVKNENEEARKAFGMPCFSRLSFAE